MRATCKYAGADTVSRRGRAKIKTNSVGMMNLRDRPLVNYRVLARGLLLLHAGKVWEDVSRGPVKWHFAAARHVLFLPASLTLQFPSYWG